MTSLLKMSDMKAQAIILNQPKKIFAIQQSIHQAKDDHSDEAYWLLMIRDLVEGAGYNYSRIAKCIDVCPSTIQKLITHPSRRPRQASWRWRRSSGPRDPCPEARCRAP